MCIICIILCATIMIALVLALRLMVKQHWTSKVKTRTPSSYGCIYIKHEDILHYTSLELTCSIQMRGRLGTKRLIITDEKMKPITLFIRMSLHRDWYRLNMTPKMHRKAKIMHEDSDAEDDEESSLKLTRCRQADIVDEILSMACDKKTSAFSLITQSQIGRVGELFGEGVRLKRRQLMTIIDDTDSI